MGKNEMELTEALEQTAGNSAPQEKRSASTQQASLPQKKLIGGHFDKWVHNQLRMMSYKEDCSMQSLLGEALNYLFEKRGKKLIALDDNRSE